MLQVVIAFIVDAFVLQLQQNSQKKMKQKKILERNIYVVAADDADCIEGECDSVCGYGLSISSGNYTVSCTWVVGSVW